MTDLSQEKDSLAIANTLSDKLLATMDDEQAAKVRHYRDLSWTGKEPNIDEIILNTGAQERETLLIAITRLGQIYDMASLVARDNALRTEQNETVGTFDSVDEALGYLNKPVFEVTMTAHPTNVNDIASIRALRDICKLLHDDPNSQALDGLIGEWAQQPLIPTKPDADGQTVPGVLSIRDETEMTLHYLKNIYDDLPLTYAPFDEALAKQSGEYDPSQLKLNMRFSSWGSSGDKDGNNNVTSETTLEAIAMHKLAIVEKYLEAVRELEENGIILETAEGVEWESLLANSSRTISQTLHQIDQAIHSDPNGQDKFMNPVKFDELTDELVKCTRLLDKEGFKNAVERAYEKADGENKQQLLDLSRRIESFGFNFGAY